MTGYLMRNKENNGKSQNHTDQIVLKLNQKVDGTASKHN